MLGDGCGKIKNRVMMSGRLCDTEKNETTYSYGCVTMTDCLDNTKKVLNNPAIYIDSLDIKAMSA